jgi:hypothetical protein
MTPDERRKINIRIHELIRNERGKNHIKLLLSILFIICIFYGITIFIFQKTINRNSESVPVWNYKTYYLRIRQEQIVKMPQYQKQHNSTFCNIATNDMFDDRSPMYLERIYGKNNIYGYYIDDFHYDLSSVFPTEKHIYMNISDTYDIMLQAAKDKKIISLTMRQAQLAANLGKLVYCISKKYNHVLSVCPDFYKYDFERGCLCCNIGEVNKIGYISDPEIFGNRWQDREIRFYQFREIGEYKE